MYAVDASQALFHRESISNAESNNYYIFITFKSKQITQVSQFVPKKLLFHKPQAVKQYSQFMYEFISLITKKKFHS